MKKEISLEGKTALVTGGGRGIGLGIAKELIDAGARVIIAGRTETELVKASKELGDAHYALIDLAKHETIPGAIADLLQKEGPIDVLVNNAGIQNNKDALDYNYDEFLSLFNVNVFGTYLVTREISRAMVERGTGSIVFITSTAVHIGLTRNLVYSGTKGALSSMVRAFASELSPKGVRVNGVAPGWIETVLTKESLRRVPERRAMVEHRTMLGRLGTEKDVGMAVTFLASDAAQYITAVEIKVDGGIAASL
ncbi:SDR family NAD(P)-dependent oxidoreductase [Ethanoligenens sp.]|uniref:SDR family NAD(P)-dependent oxidoreductase n=1 Tax=Ethanoligenens sp. TaxID=2099655 RepID=UPI0039E929DE